MKDWRGTDVYMVERYGRKEPRLRVKRKKETSPYLGNDYRLVQGRPTVLHAVDRVTVVG